jgi:hypothetical protein
MDKPATTLPGFILLTFSGRGGVSGLAIAR